MQTKVSSNQLPISCRCSCSYRGSKRVSPGISSFTCWRHACPSQPPHQPTTTCAQFRASLALMGSLSVLFHAHEYTVLECPRQLASPSRQCPKDSYCLIAAHTHTLARTSRRTRTPMYKHCALKAFCVVVVGFELQLPFTSLLISNFWSLARCRHRRGDSRDRRAAFFRFSVSRLY